VGLVVPSVRVSTEPGQLQTGVLNSLSDTECHQFTPFSTGVAVRKTPWDRHSGQELADHLLKDARAHRPDLCDQPGSEALYGFEDRGVAVRSRPATSARVRSLRSTFRGRSRSERLATYSSRHMTKSPTTRYQSGRHAWPRCLTSAAKNSLLWSSMSIVIVS